jgi:hypothetical protein
MMDALYRFENPKPASEYKWWEFGHKLTPYSSDPVRYPDSDLNEKHYKLR